MQYLTDCPEMTQYISEDIMFYPHMEYLVHGNIYKQTIHDLDFLLSCGFVFLFFAGPSFPYQSALL